eukprot:TCALIF_10594-PA protein Name:"Similar to awd Nucleoside diphosphate kinase (Drosophila melanogaster)" AED:0.69 eAED:0.69 QI:0/0/0/0.33/1/1/3/0/332
MVEGGKKKNRNRNKNKNKAVNSEVPASVEATHEAPPPVTPTPTAAETSSIANGPPTDRPKSAKKKSPSPPAAAPASAPVPAVTEKAPQTEEERQQDLLKNLAQDYQPHPMWAQVKEAEVKFYSNITNGHQSDQSSQKGAPKASSEESDVDLFASDEEPVAKPKLVQPAPKAAPTKAASKKEKKSAHSNKANAESLVDLVGAPMTSQQIHSLRVQCTFPVSQSTSSNPGKNGLNGERSFVMLKPDAVHRKMIGEIMNKLERRGFKLVATKYMKASRDLLQKHYADLSRKAFFKDLIDYMASGPVVPMVWEGLNVVQVYRFIKAFKPFFPHLNF